MVALTQLFFSDGRVFDSETFNPLGVFDTAFDDDDQQLVEPLTDLDLVYFVGESADVITLSVFDTNNFLQIDSVSYRLRQLRQKMAAA